MTIAEPSERIAFQPAIEMPRKANWIWSQRTSGVAKMSARLPRRRRAGRQAFQNAKLDQGMVDADRARHGDRRGGEQGQRRGRDAGMRKASAARTIAAPCGQRCQ